MILRLARKEGKICTLWHIGTVKGGVLYLFWYVLLLHFEPCQLGLFEAQNARKMYE